VPSPFVAEDHQTKNAMALVNNNAAILVKDKNLKKDLTNEILRIIADQDLQKELIDNITKLGMENSTKSIIEVAKSLIK
jgi:UDP-N-acetylglucosamine--N-acetylmuramyl-(pentapeptide) pyrophosphoryl-undecaprenol N-acetylglucosamine transferase